MSYKIKYTKQAAKDFERIKKSPLKKKALQILQVLETNPFKQPYEKLSNNLQGYYSRRLNIQHRIVYEVREDEKFIAVLSMWSHYENV